MSNKIYYISISILLTLLLGIYANSVKKISFLSDPQFKCIIKGECPGDFSSSQSYSDLIAKNHFCKDIIKEYTPGVDENVYEFFTYYMKMIRGLRNDMLLKSFKSESVAEVVVNGEIISSIHFYYQNGHFHLKSISGLCEVFQELDCVLERDTTYSLSLLNHLDSKVQSQ